MLPEMMMRLLDQAGRIRYGVPTSEKERLALTQALPGAPPVNSADPQEAERYASGYLFAKQHPVLQPLMQPLVDRIRTGWAGDSPELQSWAQAGANQGRMAASPLTGLMATLASLGARR